MPASPGRGPKVRKHHDPIDDLRGGRGRGGESSLVLSSGNSGEPGSCAATYSIRGVRLKLSAFSWSFRIASPAPPQ